MSAPLPNSAKRAISRTSRQPRASWLTDCWPAYPVRDAHGVVVRIVRADARQVVADLDADLPEPVCRADARYVQEMRRVDGAA